MAAEPHPLPATGHQASGLPNKADLALDIVSAGPDILDAVPATVAALPIGTLGRHGRVGRRPVTLLDRSRRGRRRRDGLRTVIFLGGCRLRQSDGGASSEGDADYPFHGSSPRKPI